MFCIINNYSKGRIFCFNVKMRNGDESFNFDPSPFFISLAMFGDYFLIDHSKPSLVSFTSKPI